MGEALPGRLTALPKVWSGRLSEECVFKVRATRLYFLAEQSGSAARTLMTMRS